MFYAKKFISVALLFTIINTPPLFCLRIISGTYSTPGETRPDMLDRFTVYNENDNDIFFAGVYDGYSKPNAAEYLSQNLHLNIFSHESLTLDPEIALNESFLRTHEEYDDEECGATVGAIIIKKDSSVLYAANAGDVQAILYSEQEVNNLSKIHLVEHELERLKEIIPNDHSCQLVSTSPRLQTKSREDSPKDQRSKSRNPVVTRRLRSQDNAIHISPRQNDDKVRQLKSLKKIEESLLRSVYLDKQDPDPEKRCSYQIKPSRALCQRFFSPYVIPNPFITSLQLAQSDKFIVLASKNFWTVVNQAAVPSLVDRFVKSAQKKLKTSFITEDVAQRVAQHLVNKAFSVQDIGNQTVIIMFFDHEN